MASADQRYRSSISDAIVRVTPKGTILSAVYVKNSYPNEREDNVYSTLQRMGVTLLRSGNKPRTKDKAYRLLISDRLTIDEVEQFIARNSEVKSVRPQRRQSGN